MTNIGSDKKAVIYTTTSCSICQAAKELLLSKGIPFSEIDVTHNAESRDRLVQMSGGRTTVPQIFIENKAIGGYDELVTYFQSKKT